MLKALKSSNESRELVDVAVRYLRGVKGTLVQQKRRDREKLEGARQNMGATNAAASAALGPMPGGWAGALAGGPAQQRLGHAGIRGGPDGTRDAYRPYVHPQQQAVPGMGQAQAEGRFDEGDVESALRGFLGRGGARVVPWCHDGSR
jgi:hypothetical protein